MEMNWVRIIQSAIDNIERSLLKDINHEEIAKTVFVSAFWPHFVSVYLHCSSLSDSAWGCFKLAHPLTIKDYIALVNYHLRRNERAYFFHRKSKPLIAQGSWKFCRCSGMYFYFTKNNKNNSHLSDRQLSLYLL